MMQWVVIALAGWLSFGILGTLALYIGYGFAMAAKRAEDAGKSQKVVADVDRILVFPVVLLDATLNVLFYSFVMLDFRRAYTLDLVTGRMDRYALNPDERKFRRAFAAFLEAFLGAKDPRGYHIKGTHEKFTWLD